VDNDGVNLLQVQAVANQVNSKEVVVEDQPNKAQILRTCKAKKAGKLSMLKAAQICCKQAQLRGSCVLDTCTTGKPKDAIGSSYVEDCIDVANKGFLRMHVGRGKCLNGKGQPYTDKFQVKRCQRQSECAEFLQSRSAGNRQVRAAQWDSKKKTCTVYQLVSKYSWAFVKAVQKKTKRYDCFKVIN